MKRIIVLTLVIVAGVAMFISCGGGGGSAEKTGIVRIIGDSN